MGPGDSQTIRVLAGDDPRNVAEEFAIRNGLGEEAARALESQIRQNIEVNEMNTMN